MLTSNVLTPLIPQRPLGPLLHALLDRIKNSAVVLVIVDE
jgi:hypothetical protein